MFDRLKRTLVDSFIGAIALGYLLAQAMLYLVNVITVPVASWARRKEFPPTTVGGGLSLLALPPLVSFIVLLLIWYVLLRWLYFTPPKTATSEQASNPARVA